jgi:hypothetical protein
MQLEFGMTLDYKEEVMMTCIGLPTTAANVLPSPDTPCRLGYWIWELNLA